MMQEEGDAGAKEESHPLLDDMEEQQQGNNKGNTNSEGMTVDRLKVKLLATAEYLRQELSTMDADKAKHLGLQAKEKAFAISLAFKALMMQCYRELAALDKDKAKELSLKYHKKAKETASKYKHKTEEVAGKYKVKAVGVAQELRTMDGDEAKERSIQMIRKAKTGYGNMSTITKIKYGVLFAIVFQFSRSTSPGAKYGKLRKHPHLCYIHDEKTQGENKVKECEGMLSPVTKGYNRWLLIGNEPMFALFAPFHPLKEGPEKLFHKVKADRNMRRKNKFYFRYPSANQSEWESKYKDQASPTEIAGLFESSDCANCPMNKLNATKKDLHVEILIVESSRDVHLPTNDTSTTQETVLKYIKENYPDRKKTACVMQQSTYEMTKAPWRTTEDYLKYTDEFHRELEDRCGILIRIGLFHTNYDLRAKIEEWDHATRDVVLDNSRNGFFIDVSNVRAPSPQGYINPVWEMFTHLMGGLQ
jgi:hypothetical protein